MTPEQQAAIREEVKATISRIFAPAIDFRAPYAKQMLEMATDAAIAAHLKALEAAGWVLVPIEPTPDMMLAAEKQHNWLGEWPETYQAMIAARPR